MFLFNIVYNFHIAKYETYWNNILSSVRFSIIAIHSVVIVLQVVMYTYLYLLNTKTTIKTTFAIVLK